MINRFEKFFWLIPIVLTWIVHWPVLYNGLVFDDASLFEHALPMFTKLREAWFHSSLPPFQTMAYYRPFYFICLMLIRSFSGYEPWGYHLILLILHTLNTVLVYFLSLRFFKGRDSARLGALVASTLFALHPIHVEVVAWISATVEALMTLFFLLAFYLFILFRDNPQRKLWLVLSAFSFLLSLFSKETAVTFLLVAFLYDMVFVKSLSKKPTHLKTTYIVYLMAFLFYFGMRYLNVPQNPLQIFTVTPSEGALKFIISLGYYFQKILWPNVLNPFGAALPTATNFVLGSLILVVGVSIICTYTLKYNRLLFFFIMFFIITLLPGALVPLSSVSKFPLADRYLYLSSYGFCFLFGWFIMPALSK